MGANNTNHVLTPYICTKVSEIDTDSYDILMADEYFYL